MSKDIFEFICKAVDDKSKETGRSLAEAFPEWFIKMYFQDPSNLFISNGSRDGQIDTFFTTQNESTVNHHVVNSKYTERYNITAPPAFYEELLYFNTLFKDANGRDEFLAKAIKSELVPRYKKLFKAYDNGNASLIFLTNLKRNDAQFMRVKKLGIEIFHMEDIMQHVVDDLELAMPRTPDMEFQNISMILTPNIKDSIVPTAIVFARLIDFIKYMENDPKDLLFARNVRLVLKGSHINKEIQRTFQTNPEEFVFSNNGITMLCESFTHTQDHCLILKNPRVVNGSQTLHSIRDLQNPSNNAKVIVKIISTLTPDTNNLEEEKKRRKDVINKISIRSNQQNPIKKWDLASQDDFQLEIYRVFRRHRYFYERRTGEWNERSRELKSVNIEKGTNIKLLMQLIASFYWSDNKLGPAIAYSDLGQLFEKRQTTDERSMQTQDKAYDRISKNDPELVFRIFMFYQILQWYGNELSIKKKYKSLLKIGKFTIFATFVKASQCTGIKWHDKVLTEKLVVEWDKFDDRWFKMIKRVIEPIYDYYNKQTNLYKRKFNKELNHVNFFKSQQYVSRILKNKPPMEICRFLKDKFN